MAEIINLGPVGFNPTGNYDNTRSYEKLDMVLYQGSSYVAKQSVIGQLPTNVQYWDCVATGTLKQFTYDSVAEMKLDNSLEDGMYAFTGGYYSVNDGGGATYRITSEESETEYQEELDNGLYATLINDKVYPEMFGAYGDNIHNDTNAFNTLINNFDTMYLNKKTYKVTKLIFTKDFTIHGNYATITDDGTNDNLLEMNTSTTNKTLHIFNLIINAPNSDTCIYINKNKLFANNIEVKNARNINIHIVKTGSNGSCKINEIRCQLSPIGIQIDATDCFIENYVGYNCLTHLKNNSGLTHINKFHGWNYNQPNKDWITNSTLIDTRGSLIGNDIYIDTLENGIKLPTDYPHLSVILQNVSYFLNTSSYPSTQQAPTLLKNVENFNGYCKIDGFHGDENNWKDSNNNYPVLIDNIDTSRISLTNVTNSGFRFNRYKAIETNEDIATTSYSVSVGTYLTMNVRKVKYKDYNIHVYMKGNMKTGCASGNIMYQASFTGQQLNNLNIKTRVRAIFVESSNDGVVYDLPAYIDNNARLSIYNNTGVLLGGSGHYGELHVYIDDIHQN